MNNMNGNLQKILFSIVSGLLVLTLTMAWRFYDNLDGRLAKVEEGQIQIRILLAGKGYSDNSEKSNLYQMLKDLNRKLEPVGVPEP